MYLSGADGPRGSTHGGATGLRHPQSTTDKLEALHHGEHSDSFSGFRSDLGNGNLRLRDSAGIRPAFLRVMIRRIPIHQTIGLFRMQVGPASWSARHSGSLCLSGPVSFNRLQAFSECRTV